MQDRKTLILIKGKHIYSHAKQSCKKRHKKRDETDIKKYKKTNKRQKRR